MVDPSKAAKIVALVKERYEEALTTQHGRKELRLDDFELFDDDCTEVTPEQIVNH